MLTDSTFKVTIIKASKYELTKVSDCPNLIGIEGKKSICTDKTQCIISVKKDAGLKNAAITFDNVYVETAKDSTIPVVDLGSTFLNKTV